MKVLLVTNFTPHYRAPFYERLAQTVDVEFIFFSQGTEPYWQRHLGTTPADVRASTILGRHLGAGLNLNPRLARELWTRDYDVLIKCLNGRLELASAYTIAKARRKPFVFWSTIWWHPVTFLGWLSQPPLHRVYRGADAIIAEGGQVGRFIAGHGVDTAKLFTAELAVDNEWFMRPVDRAEREALRASLGAVDRPLILAVSRLVPEKGLDGLFAPPRGSPTCARWSPWSAPARSATARGAGSRGRRGPSPARGLPSGPHAAAVRGRRCVHHAVGDHASGARTLGARRQRGSLSERPGRRQRRRGGGGRPPRRPQRDRPHRARARRRASLRRRCAACSRTVPSPRRSRPPVTSASRRPTTTPWSRASKRRSTSPSPPTPLARAAHAEPLNERAAEAGPSSLPTRPRDARRPHRAAGGG